RLPTLKERFKVPHFDGKGAADAAFAAEGVPTTYMLAAFYWDNLVGFGMGPRRGGDGSLAFALPLGGVALPGIAAEDIGRCALGILRLGRDAVGARIGISGGNLSGAEMAAKMGRALGQEVRFVDVPFAAYRALGFPGADDLGNMFEFQAILGDEFQRARDPRRSRELNPRLQDFDAWLKANAAKLPIQ
ncbi:MAG TPA: NmrA family NAD(P)-binding protein, partial [Candidatus Eisenbacteria bacterium]|nr:NmrA family NAD(P)-binding protein [Candidatus Eisenbacteria bacterium]